ncbi:MAG: molecular chaperone HtpG [Ruminococcaceae bacterium]|nr:molecular chaperone HtpG [Oscillospiraceae bacterium]
MKNTFEKQSGGISVQTSHIFPVIKKWLYSEKEIFVRELVSNASDAVTKLKRLSSLGQYDADGEEFRITVKLDREEKTLTVSDNGIGMNADEVKKYICNIALSGALEFIEKYEQGDASNGIIGHFGLGFYSAFMVASTVEIVTASIDGSPAVHWECSDDGDYTIEGASYDRGHGTDVILHLSSEGEEYLNGRALRNVLDKYCAFMPVDIYYEDSDDKKDENAETKPINDTAPLWQKAPSTCTEEEYADFYTKLFNDYRKPLFQIHINAEYPLNFKGILYFPPIRSEYDNLEGQVKLYYNQVFVADNIKEVIPDFLLMLKGALDCPDLPLNVSRSYLQNSGYVSKISAHIVKKVADKINGLYNTEREKFNEYWKDIRIFVEYGCLRDKKFYDRVKDSLLLRLTSGELVSVNEYLESAKEKHEGKIYYATDKIAQAQYISMFESQGIKVALVEGPLDFQFISMLESENSVKFLRIDSDVADALKGEDSDAFSDDALAEIFKNVSGVENLKVEYSALKDEGVPAILNIPEEMRRMNDMMRYYMQNSEEAPMTLGEATLILNTKNSLIRTVSSVEDSDKKTNGAKQIWSLALLAQRTLTAEELKTFLAQCYTTLEDSLKK